MCFAVEEAEAQAAALRRRADAELQQASFPKGFM